MDYFNATLDSPKVLKGIFEAISFLIDETYLFCGPEGMKMHAIDSSHVAMLLAVLPKELFTAFTCNEECKVGINIQDFIKILRRAKANDEIQLRVDKVDKNTLIIKMKSDKSTRTFKIKSKEIQGYDAKEEGLLESFETTLKDKFTATITLEGTVLDEVVKDALIISDLVKINVRAVDKILAFSASDESGEVNVELDLGGKGTLDSAVKSDAEGIYSLNFLENIIKIQAIADNFAIALGQNIPAKIEGNIVKLEAADKAGAPAKTIATGKITYLLAPRVEDQGEGIDGQDAEEADFETSSSSDEVSGDGEEKEGEG